MRAILVVFVPFLSGCGTDKILHVGAGFGAGLVSDEIIGDYGCEMAIAIGIAKEMIDPIFSIPDLIATSAYCLLPLF